MKKLLLSVAALTFAAGSSAFAADLRMPVKAPQAPPPVVTNWTGCYLNAGAGYGMWNQEEFIETSPGLAALTTTYTNGGRGWLGRFGGGCDYQFGGGPGGGWVIGAFADYDTMDLKGTASLANVGVGGIFGPPVAGVEKETDSWAAGGRLGYLVTPSLLGYVDGGYTEARFSARNLFLLQTGAPSGVTYPAHTYNGWFIGGGTEYALDFNWLPIHGLFWRTEYRYDSYQSANIPGIINATGAANGFAANDKKFVQTVTTSLVWRFNFGGPLAARY